MKDYRQIKGLVTSEKDNLYRAYDKGYKQGKADFSRLNGKWKRIPHELGTFFQCSKCASIPGEFTEHFIDGTDEWSWYRFCPFCGAEMEKEGELK